MSLIEPLVPISAREALCRLKSFSVKYSQYENILTEATIMMHIESSTFLQIKITGDRGEDIIINTSRKAVHFYQDNNSCALSWIDLFEVYEHIVNRYARGCQDFYVAKGRVKVSTDEEIRTIALIAESAVTDTIVMTLEAVTKITPMLKDIFWKFYQLAIEQCEGTEHCQQSYQCESEESNHG